MALVYGEIDSLENLIALLNKNGVDYLSSIEDIKLFETQFDSKINEIESSVKARLDAEIREIKTSIPLLETELKDKVERKEKELIKEKEKLTKEIQKYSKKPKEFYLAPVFFIKKVFLQKRKGNLVSNLNTEKKKPFIGLEKSINTKINKLKYLENNQKNEVSKRLASEASLILKAKKVIDDNKQLYFGAIGEQKAADELNKLSKEYILINNFKLELDQPIFNKSTNQRIYSIQADHIIVGPTGIFLIETKNWSQASINNLDLYSPVEQIKRSSFALFCILNNAIKTGELPSLNDNWGDKKISVRNIILMVSAKPNKEFQFVKILDLSGVNRYIKYFDRIYSDKEVEELVEFLV